MFQQLTRLLIDVLSTVVPYGILLATIVWIVWRKYRRDKLALRSYLASENGTFLSMTWAPFGPGWAGERNDRIYVVKYRNGRGETEQAYAKVSSTGAVYLRRR